MYRKFLLALCTIIVFSSGLTFSQGLSDQNALGYDLEKVKLFLSKNQYDSAADLSLKIGTRAQKQKLWPEFIDASTFAVRSLVRLRLYDSALHVARNAYNAARPYGADHYKKFAELARQYFNTIHFAGDDFFNTTLIREMKAYLGLIKTIPVRERFVDSVTYKVYEQLGSTCYNLDVFDQSLRYYDSALQISLKLFGERSLQTAEIYSRFNILNINIGDYASAYDFVTQSYSIIREKVSDDDPLLALATGRIGEYWVETSARAEDIQKALGYLNDAVKIINLPRNKENYFRRVQLHFVFSKAYLKLGDYAAANKYVDMAIQLWSEQQTAHFGTPAELLTHKAKVLLALGEYQEAKKLIDESSVVYVNGGYNELARNYTLKGDVYQAQMNSDSALYFYHQAFHVLVPQAPDSLNYLRPMHIGNESPNETLLTALIKRARVKGQIAETHKKQEYLQSALSDYLELSQYLKQSRRSIINSHSKIRYKERTSSIYEAGIECAIKLYEVEHDQEYLRQAFKLADFRKYSLILDQLEDFQIRNHLGVDPQLLMQEKQLTDELNIHLQQHHNLVLNREADTELIKAAEKNIFEMKMKLREFSKTLSAKYPGYYHLKYDGEEMITDSGIKNITDPDRLILQYFAGEKNSYVFATSGDQWHYNRIENAAATDSLILVCIEGLKNRLPQQFSNSSHELYQQLLSKTLKNFPSKKHLVIIPDGRLGYLPFETLLVSKPGSSASYRTNDYLIRHYQVSYHYSASLLTFNKKSAYSGVSGFLGYAPNAKASISPLPGNLSEVKAIAAIMDGQIKEGNAATESSFKREASTFNILHLASHNVINDRDPLYSQLFFTEVNEPSEDDILHTYELYTTKLNADLVSLSACNTGIGKLYHGEGIMSLGTGFFYAGVPNVLTSLWDISDQSTSDIMTYFYEELRQGTDYADALHQAKLRYLNESDNVTADPHYWGGFVFIGQPSQEASWKKSEWLIATTIVLFSAIIIYGISSLRKRRIKKVIA